MQQLQICIGPIIRIGRESWCLPYAGFFVCWFVYAPVPVQARYQSAPLYPELHPDPDSDILPDYLDLDDIPMDGGDLNRSELRNKMVWKSLVDIANERFDCCLIGKTTYC